MSFVELSATAQSKLRDILARPKGRKIGVLGLGVSGRSMAKLLHARGAQVTGIEQKEGAKVDLPDIEYRYGKQPDFSGLEAVAISPGVDTRTPAIQALLQNGIPVLGELELAGQLPARVVAITGTNGKSTTTALTGSLVEGLQQTAFVGGNLGVPFASWLADGGRADVMVLELSSFQLETAYTFAPDVGVVLNVTPDHLDRYESVAQYAGVKEDLVRAVPQSGTVVLNADDPTVRRMAKSARGRVLWFSARGADLPGDGLTCRNGEAVGVGALSTFMRVSLKHPRLFGSHNHENALAAFLAVYALDLVRASEQWLPGYLSFQGLEHRLEWVRSVDGVRYINDSKATNDISAATAVSALDEGIILLVGGKDKGAGYKHLAQAAPGKVRLCIVFGEAAPIAADALQAVIPTLSSTSMLAACQTALEHAKPGDTVLLSPACASYDAFTDYAQRGKVFKNWVHNLESKSHGY